MSLLKRNKDTNRCTEFIELENNWDKDYKYLDAEYGFSLGYKNPVPLTKVSYDYIELSRTYIDDSGIRTIFGIVRFLFSAKSAQRENISTIYQEHFGFGDGMTRTMWLLQNGASSFPILCDKNGAKLFANTVGIKTSEP